MLDEPTNNLELEAVAALADAVDAFEGGVVCFPVNRSCALLRTAKSRSSQVLVSHEQYFVQRVAREVHIVEGGKVRPMESFAACKTAIAKKVPILA